MMARKQWRCFYCDDVFTRAQDAVEHFGGTQHSLAGCQLKGHETGLLGLIREQEVELAGHRNDDSEVIRLMMTMRADHADAVRRAEELGYDRGVQDMKRLASPEHP